MPDDDQPVHVDGFWFVMKWIFLFLVSLLLMSQLALLIRFKTADFLELDGLLFLLVSSFLTCFVLNVITELVFRATRKTEMPKQETLDES
jgi:hypothetical protein